MCRIIKDYLIIIEVALFGCCTPQFSRVCRSFDPPLGSPLAEQYAAGIMACAALCRQRSDCHYIAVKQNNGGLNMCVLYRPGVFCGPEDESGTWITYRLDGVFICESGWWSYGQSCYLYGVSYVIWSEARNRCSNMNSTLVSITNEDEDLFVHDLPWNLGYYNYGCCWIGGYILLNSSHWEWLTGEPFVFEMFEKGQPNETPGEDRLVFHENGGWHDASENNYCSFVCERVSKVI